jgi:hypothetical protein
MFNSQQFVDFKRDGIVRVSRAIPAADVEAMTALVWDNLERRYPVRRNRPDTWTPKRINGLHALDDSVTFEEIGSATVCQMLDDVFGTANWQRPARWGYLLIAFLESHGPWDIPHGSWHLDFPASCSLQGMFLVRLFTCLRPVLHGGGSTLVVAGSHRLVEDVVRKNSHQRLRSADIRTALIQTYPWVRALCSRRDGADRIARFMDSATRINDIELRVIEMTGEPGDVFLVHALNLHAYSPNCSDAPRMVLSSFVYRNGVGPSAFY